MDSAREVVKYFKNKTLVHGLLDKARKHVKVHLLDTLTALFSCPYMLV